MSTTFAAQMSTIIGWKITCACGDGAGPMFGSWVEAAAHLRVFVDDESLRTVLPGCQDGEFCLMYRLSATAIESDPSPALNVGNGNAADLFHALGMGTDEDGSSFGSTPVPGSTAVYDVFDGGWMDADEFLGRVLVAMAVAPTDHGRAEQVSFGVGAVMTRCARPAGYLQGRLADLHEIALFAQRLILPMQHAAPPGHLPIVAAHQPLSDLEHICDSAPYTGPRRHIVRPTATSRTSYRLPMGTAFYGPRGSVQPTADIRSFTQC